MISHPLLLTGKHTQALLHAASGMFSRVPLLDLAGHAQNGHQALPPFAPELLIGIFTKTGLRLLLLTAFWLLGIGAGFVALLNYAATPGKPGTPGSTWPTASRLTLDPATATLVMAVHPRCPCSRASIASLAQVMARGQGLVTAHVLFYKPTGAALGWEQTDLWRSATAIPGVVVHSDEDGLEARRFGAVTSGQTQLYSPNRKLLFSGGITIARGHEGENAGLDAVIAYLTLGKTEQTQCHVYGCPIQTVIETNSRRDVP